MVVAARDKDIKDSESPMVAIKKIEKAFEHKIFTKRTLRELKILRLLNHENVHPFSILKKLTRHVNRSSMSNSFNFQSQENNTLMCKIHYHISETLFVK